MSKETLAAFLKKVAEDEALRKELTQFAAEHGFEFTSDELREADLDNVAGGAGSVGVNAMGVGSPGSKGATPS